MNTIQSTFILVLLLFSGSVMNAQFPPPLQPNTKPDLRTYRERGDEQFRLGNYKEASEFYSTWLLANPRDTSGYVFCARSMMKLNQPDKALAVLKAGANAGCAHWKAIDDQQDFSIIKNKPEWNEVKSIIQQNEDNNNDFVLRFAKQERWGRYRILFPKTYDSKLRYHLVLLLHGNSQEPQVILKWAKELQLEQCIIVCPEAPYVKLLETITQGKMRLSAAGEELGMPDSMKYAIVDESSDWYMSVLSDAQRTLPVYKELPIVVGFSQGGFYTNCLITRYPNRFRSAVMMCASYFDFGGIAERLPNVKRYGIDVLHVHGRQDPIVPFQTAELIHALFERNGVTNTFIPYDGTHWMTPDITRKVSEWIVSHFE